MKLIKKIFVFMSMLFVGLSWQKTVSVENMAKVKAAEVKSYATLKSGENYEVNSGGPFGGSSGYTPLEQAIIDSNLGITISDYHRFE